MTAGTSGTFRGVFAVTGLAAVVGIAIDVTLGTRETVLALTSVLLVFVPTILVCVRLHRLHAAQLLLIYFANFVFILPSFATRHQNHADYYAFPAMFLALLFYDLRRPYYLVLSLLPPILGVILILLNVQIPMPSLTPKVGLDSQVVELGNCLGAIIATGSLIAVYLKARMNEHLGEIAKLKQAYDLTLAANHQVDFFFKSGIDIFCILHKDGIIERINPRFTEVLGFGTEEVIGKPFFGFFDDQEKSRVALHLSKVGESSTREEFEAWSWNKNKELRILSWSIVLDRHAGFVYASARDVTRERTEASDLRQTLEAIGRGAMLEVTDIGGRIVSANPNFCEISGYTQEELIGQDHRIFKSGAHSRSFYNNLWRTISRGEIWTGEILNRSKSGRLFSSETIIAPLKDIAGRVVRYLVIRVDTSVRRTVEASLREAQEVARLGGWTFEVQSQSFSWSSYLNTLHVMDASIRQLSMDQLMGLMIESDRTLWLARFKEAVDQGLELRVRSRRIVNGETRWFEDVGRPVFGLNGKVVQISGVCQDVTERVHLEGERRRILDWLKIGVWTYRVGETQKNRMLEFDETMYELFGFDRGCQKYPIDVWTTCQTPESAEWAGVAFQRAVNAGEEFKPLLEIVRPDQTRAYLANRGQVIRNSKGEVEAIVGISYDRTQEKAVELELEAEKAKAVQASKLAALGEVAAGIAHEINNPLAIISGVVSILPNVRDNPRKFEAKLAQVKISVERISRIVTGLKRYVHKGSKQVSVPIDLVQIVRDSLEFVEQKAIDVGVQLRRSVAGHEAMILGDVGELQQVLVNLLGNAIDAVAENSEKWVGVRIISEPDSIAIWVEDSGPGIPPEVERKLFQPFFTTKGVGKGTGLGLSISRTIVMNHGGTLELRREHANTCFELRFKRYNGNKSEAA